MKILILVTSEAGSTLCLMTKKEVETCRDLLKDYQDTLEWPEVVNMIIDQTQIKPGSLCYPADGCFLLSKGLISTEGDSGGYYKNGLVKRG